MIVRQGVTPRLHAALHLSTCEHVKQHLVEDLRAMLEPLQQLFYRVSMLGQKFELAMGSLDVAGFFTGGVRSVDFVYGGEGYELGLISPQQCCRKKLKDAQLLHYVHYVQFIAQF